MCITPFHHPITLASQGHVSPSHPLHTSPIVTIFNYRVHILYYVSDQLFLPKPLQNHSSNFWILPHWIETDRGKRPFIFPSASPLPAISIGGANGEEETMRWKGACQRRLLATPPRDWRLPLSSPLLVLSTPHIPGFESATSIEHR